MGFTKVAATTLVPHKARGVYDEIGEAVIELADTDECIAVDGYSDEVFRSKVIPAVRRMVSQKLDRKLIVGIQHDAGDEPIEGVVLFSVGGAITHDGGPNPTGTTAQKAAAAKKAAAKK
jgi:hypothetical protein